MSDFNICHACHGVGEIDRAVSISEFESYIDKITCPYCLGRGQYRGAPIRAQSISTKEAQARSNHYFDTLFYCLKKYGPVEFVNHLGEELKRGKHGFERIT